MLSLDPSKLAETSIPVGTVWLLGACMEARGKQDLWLAQKPEVLAVLREQALIRSVESSNRLEGVTVPAHRLRPLVLGTVRARDRSEEELTGYRRALDWISSRTRSVVVSPDLLERLHALSQGGVAGDAGNWKQRDNEITEISPSGERRVRFVPTPARETPATIARLCENYMAACEEQRVPSLLVVASLVFDFLCVHPFRDGNGRVSRLLNTLLLQSHGFLVPSYVSLERAVEEDKEEYYRVLGACSEGWHEGTNQIVPWWNHFLGVLRRAYQEMERQVASAAGRPAKSELVRQAAMAQVEPFALADLAAQLPSVSPQLIKKILARLRAEGRLSLEGRGRGARWEVTAG